MNNVWHDSMITEVTDLSRVIAAIIKLSICRHRRLPDISMIGQ